MKTNFEIGDIVYRKFKDGDWWLYLIVSDVNKDEEQKRLVLAACDHGKPALRTTSMFSVKSRGLRYCDTKVC